MKGWGLKHNNALVPSPFFGLSKYFGYPFLQCAPGLRASLFISHFRSVGQKLLSGVDAQLAVDICVVVF